MEDSQDSQGFFYLRKPSYHTTVRPRVEVLSNIGSVSLFGSHGISLFFCEARIVERNGLKEGLARLSGHWKLA